MSTLLEPGQIPQASGEPPLVLPPDAKDVFAHRARRFAQLAEGHPLGDYLRFMGRLAQAQQRALDAMAAVPVPDDAAKSQSRQHGMPLVPAQSWPRDAAWRA
ncbi:MAG: formate dehydrogenase accessory protein FdhE, partial [Candidatus Desulfobacillus denitrificans]